MSLLCKARDTKGYDTIVSPGDEDLKLLEFAKLTLSDGESYSESGDGKEIALVILAGKCAIKAGYKEWREIGERAEVFGGKAYAVYIPAPLRYEVVAKGDVEIAIFKAPSDQKGEVTVITPSEVKVRSVGVLNWRRDVHDIIDSRVNAQRLIVGETFNPPGNWSSAPPHKHDVDNPPQEYKLEELYHFHIQPKQGFGIQRIYTADGSVNETYVIEDGDTMKLPYGYHPVVAAPGYSLYYLWALAGEKRIMKPNDDPAHTWLKDCEAIVKEVK